MATPVWIWLPDTAEPSLAATLDVAPGDGRWSYQDDYLARTTSVAADPVRLRLAARARGILLPKTDGLAGVVRDAMPSGYGADRLHARAGRNLGTLELLEQGVPDSVGALEVCEDIDRKLEWVPHHFDTLKDLLTLLDDDAPASHAVRRMNEGASTSAGGERPKLTIQDKGRLWLAKMQDRGELPFLPAKEFAVMELARECGIRIPDVRLEAVGERSVYLIERFDRSGDPLKPERRLYASAHTVLDLDLAAVRGDPSRSYLALADEMRIWCRGNPGLPDQLQELWRRMAFNALVGNTDDHPRNHGLVRQDGHWGLTPAFDITPTRTGRGPVVLAMATGVDGAAIADPRRLVAASTHFGVAVATAAEWLRQASTRIADQWAGRMRSCGVTDTAIADIAQAFRLSEDLAEAPDLIDEAAEACRRPRRVRTARLT